MAMTRAQFRKQLQEGLNTVFGLEYTRHTPEYPAIFGEEKSSTKAYEEDVLTVGLGPAQVKPEGGPVAHDAGSEGWVARYVHLTVALAFQITEEAEEDNLYASQGARYSKALAHSMIHTKETYGANILNNGFDAGYPIGDGEPLFSTQHPLKYGGVFSNRLATGASLSEAAIESACIRVSRFVDDRGLPVLVRVMRLHVPPELRFEAHRILRTVDRPGTADNDTNALKDMNMIPKGFAVNHRFTDPDSWFLTTDCPDGLKHMRRTRVSRGVEGDFDTGNMRYKGRERYSFGATNPRGSFGVPG